MSSIRGTSVAARIAPFDTADTYATHEEEWGRGGYRTVADIAERDAITDPRRKEGMICKVLGDKNTYILVGGIANSNWEEYSTAASNLEPIEDVLFGVGGPTGFIRNNPITMGVLEFSINGTDIISYNSDGSVATNSSGNFDDGGANQTAAAARTMALFPSSGESEILVMVDAKLLKLSGIQTIEIPDTTEGNYIYLDATGVIQIVNSWSDDLFTATPIVGYTYWNADSGKLIDYTDARHGIAMNVAEKVRLFAINGTDYVSGMDIVGLTSGGTTFSQINSGKAYSADKVLNVVANTSVKTLYLYGANKWETKATSSDVAYIDGVAKYNKFDGTDYQLEDVTGDNLMVVVFALTGDNYGSYSRLLGQSIYTSVDAARASVAAELTQISHVGLAGMNYLPVSAVVVNSDGEVQALDDGSLYIDLRRADITSTGAMSPVAVSHADLSGLDTDSVHKATSISFDNTVDGKLVAENMQAALDESYRLAVKKGAGYAIALG